jgi:hypothetical protein
MMAFTVFVIFYVCTSISDQAFLFFLSLRRLESLKLHDQRGHFRAQTSVDLRLGKLPLQFAASPS